MFSTAGTHHDCGQPDHCYPRWHTAAKDRPRFGRGHVYTPTTTVDHQHHLGWAAKAAMTGRRPLTSAVKITALFELPIPPSWSARRRANAITGLIMPTARPDIDNYIKAVLDAINGIVITDDAQIVEINARKIYGTPKTIFTVQPLPERACAVRARNLDFDLTANSEKSNSTGVTNEQ